MLFSSIWIWACFLVWGQNCTLITTLFLPILPVSFRAPFFKQPHGKDCIRPTLHKVDSIIIANGRKKVLLFWGRWRETHPARPEKWCEAVHRKAGCDGWLQAQEDIQEFERTRLWAATVYIAQYIWPFLLSLDRCSEPGCIRVGSQNPAPGGVVLHWGKNTFSWSQVLTHALSTGGTPVLTLWFMSL